MKVLGWVLTVVGAYETIGSIRGVIDGTLGRTGLVISILVLIGGLTLVISVWVRERLQAGRSSSLPKLQGPG
jgi:hypothetical protein